MSKTMRVLRAVLLGLMLIGLLFLVIPRPVLALAQDTDADGLTDDQEAILGTDPRQPDTDGDGLADGEEFFVYLTDPRAVDTDNDGLSDAEDPFPWALLYKDLSGVTTTRDSLLGPLGDLRLHQLVQVKVGNVITIDWTNFLNDDFTLRETDFTIDFDFLDPQRQDFSGHGYYRPTVGEDGRKLMEIRLPTYEGIFETTVPWPGNAMTISDWVYHLYGKPLKVGQTWEFNVFYHEFLPWGEDPFFRVRAEIVDETTVPIETRLGRREYRAYEVRAVFRHVTFENPFFRAFLGPDPELNLQAFIAVGENPRTQAILRYTTPFFRITPTPSVGFSDFLVQR